ncbi:hypothetical protein [Psychrobacter sp. I-STPA10]|uniref:hypothetical protein n=1 Tax=Psychrobacter sp. I-STPA10 TaxID=2585769 RepID=UPI001E3AFDCA|nr:hypothetical protein [Psychrobacter sp. I-STPA10]
MKNTYIANAPEKKSTQTLGGLWLEKGLNPNLIAKIRPIIEGNIEGGQGNQTYTVDTNEPEVMSLFEDAEFSIEAQYSTPFESSNPEGRMPNMMGMIQSGQLPSALYSFFGIGDDGDGGLIDSALQSVNGTLKGLVNRSNFTKLNSRQIYTSSNSVRISGTLVLQAWADAKTEVEAVMQKLQQWTSPKQLSSQSLIVGAAQNGITEGLFPSVIPPIVQMQYGGCTYKPLFIESISAPITAPMTPDGSRIAVRATITLLSLTAWDKSDITNLRR